MKPDTVIIPLSALVTFPPGTQVGVFVAEGDKAAKRLVKTGDILSSSILVTGGLKAGERVVTSGAAFLHDGASIVIADN
jgi:multidrug efflux pump subunit AcrA (membrane-fusion protein)